MTTPVRPRIFVMLGRDQDAGSWRARFDAGEALDRTPYGYDRAEDDYDLAWSVSSSEGRVGRRWRVAVSRVLGFDLVHVWRNRPAIRSADAVWTHTEREHLAVAAVQLLRSRRRRTPVLAQSVWLWDEWPAYGSLRRRGYGLLLRMHAVELVHSALNAEIARREVPQRPVVRVPFGTSALPRPDGRVVSAGSPYLLVVGSDRDRDWETLRSAANGLDLDVTVVTRSRSAHAETWPDNVRVVRVERLSELARLYAGAVAVVVPLRPNVHASGTTTCIEAMAAGRCLVVTDVGGISEYVGGQATLVEPSSPGALRVALERAVRGELEPAVPAEVARRGLTQRDYVARFEVITRAVLDGRPIPSSASGFAPVIPGSPHDEG